MRFTILLAVAAMAVTACGPRAPAIQFERTSADSLVEAKRISDILGCTGCHGAELTGEDWSEPGFGRLWTANVTKAAAGYTDEQLARIIRTGASPDRDLWGMPSFLFTQLSDDDMAAVVAFIRSKPVAGVVHPAPLFEEAARREIAAGDWMSARAEVAKDGETWPPGTGDEHALGRYIVRATCAECHGMDLRGGGGPGMAPRPDLSIVGAYEPEQFRHLLRTGKAVGNREVGLMSEVARGRYSHLTDTEVDAIYAYLKRLADTAPQT